MAFENHTAGAMVAALVSTNGDEAGEVEALSDADRERKELAAEPVSVQAAYEFLGRKGITLWGDFLISAHHGRLRASRWLAAEMAGVEKILRSDWCPLEEK